MRSLALSLALLVIFTASLSAQGRSSQRSSWVFFPGDRGFFAPRSVPPLGFFHFRVPPEFGAAVFAHQFFVGGHRPFHLSPRRGFHGFWGGPGRYGFIPYARWGGTPTLYTSRTFVEQWRDRDPVGPSPGEGATRSTLLSQGMDEAEVMGKLGSPVERVVLRDREVWKYSGYSLLFEGGRLKEIR